MEGILNFVDLTPQDAQMILLYCVVFFFFWQGMTKLFWAPYLKLYEQREALTEGAESTAQSQINEAAKVREEYESKISAARVEAMQEKLGKIAEASKKASVLVAAAEQKASDEIAKAREELKQNFDSVKNEAFAEADSMVDQIVDNLKRPLSEIRSSIN